MYKHNEMTINYKSEHSLNYKINQLEEVESKKCKRSEIDSVYYYSMSNFSLPRYFLTISLLLFARMTGKPFGWSKSPYSLHSVA